MGIFRPACALLILPALLSGCLRAETPPPPAPSVPPPADAVSAEPMLEISGIEDASLLADGDPLTAVPVKGIAVLEVSPPKGGGAVDYLEIDADGEISATVAVDGTVIYDGGDGDSTFLRFDGVEVDTFTLTLRGDASVREIRCGRVDTPAHLFAYLPASTPPDQLENRLDKLERVTVITAVCWDKSGDPVEIEDNFTPLVEKLREKRAYAIYATVYPAADLVRAGTAGETIDTPVKRSALAAGLLRFARENGLDGIDIDWETPKDETEWRNFSALITETAALFGGSAGLSVALYPADVGKLSQEAVAAVGTLNLMTYDQFDAQGRHATFSGMAGAVQSALGAGFTPGQIAVGIPAYGRPPDGAALWPLYNGQGLGYSQNRSDAGYFNSQQLARDKAAYAAARGLQGVFLYHLMGDFPSAHESSLLGAMD